MTVNMASSIPYKRNDFLQQNTKKMNYIGQSNHSILSTFNFIQYIENRKASSIKKKI